MPVSASPAPNAVKANYKGCNVTVLGRGLQTQPLDPTLFPELGPHKTLIQVGPVGVLEFDRRSLVVQVEAQRAVAADSGPFEENGTAAELMQRYIDKATGVQITAIGFNYFFEFVCDGDGVNFVEKFLDKDRMIAIGGPPTGAGFKILQSRGPYVRQLTIDPVWNNAKVLLCGLNYHLDAPLAKINIPERFAECAAEIPKLIEATINV
jgi:hypothetical protein